MNRTHLGWLLIALVICTVGAGLTGATQHGASALLFGLVAFILILILLDEVAF